MNYSTFSIALKFLCSQMTIDNKNIITTSETEVRINLFLMCL